MTERPVTLLHALGKPGKNGIPVAGTLLNVLGIGFDIAELEMAVCGEGSQVLALLLGSAGSPVGTITAWIVDRFGVDAAETLFSNVNLVNNLLADTFNGYTYADYDTGEVVLGQNTIFNLSEQLVDVALPALPETDIVINGSMLIYDFLNLTKVVPNLLEYRVLVREVQLISIAPWRPTPGPLGEGYFVRYHGPF